MNTINTQPFDVWADKEAQHDEQRILAAMGPLLDWLAELHGKGQAHGNIQPGNLTVSDHNFINLALFEAAASQIMVSNSEYAPPEADQNPRPTPTVQGDVYAISAVLYRAISGQSPMRATSRVARKADALPMNSVGAAVAEGISKGLSLQPEARPSSLKDLRDLLLPAGATPVKPAKEACPGQVATQTNVPASPATAPPPPAPSVPQPPQPPTPTIVKRLPKNLTVGRPATIAITDLLKDPSSWQIRFLNAEELGMPFDEATKSLVGTPKLPGEHELQIELTHPETNGRPPLKQSIAVTVNPDPDSLWKNLPSDEKDPYFKPDTDHKDSATPYGRIVAASQRGRSHAHEGLFRDDDFLFRFDESSSWHLLAAADGAGSAKFSRRGSQIACEHAVAFMGKWLAAQGTTLDAAVQMLVEKGDTRLMRPAAYSWLGGAAFEARKAIQFEAEHKDPPATLRDYHTTILLAAAKPTHAGWVIASFSIGDGGIALRRVNGEPVSLCSPDSGEYGGQTVFLTASNVLSDADQIMQRIHTYLAPDLSALVLMTDGVTDPKFPTEVSLSDPAVWNAFWSELTGSVGFQSANKETSSQLLKWLAFRSPGNHDDRTIALLLPNAQSEQKGS